MTQTQYLKKRKCTLTFSIWYFLNEIMFANIAKHLLELKDFTENLVLTFKLKLQKRYG